MTDNEESGKRRVLRLPSPARRGLTIAAVKEARSARVQEKLQPAPVKKPPRPPRCSFGRRAKLTGPKEFRRVFHSLLQVKGVLRVYAHANRHSRPRLGMAISRRHAAHATERNRIRRVVRESFRLHQHQLGAWDIVVTATPGIEHKTNKELFELLVRHWAWLMEQCKPS